MKPKVLGGTCLMVLCAILVAGLWPFHRPKNDVSWLPNENGLRLGKHNTILSSDSIPGSNAADEPSCSIEAWLTPDTAIPDSATFLAFYTPENPFQLSLRQYSVLVMLSSTVGDQLYQPERATFGVDNVFRKGNPVFITITSGPQRTAVYVDGILAQTIRESALSSKTCAGQLILGGSPVKGSGWTGQLRGLAIYHHELSPTQVLEHYESWTKQGRPRLTGNERTAGLYLFDERAGNVVHNQIGSGSDLYIPEGYRVVHQKFLEWPWREYRSSWGYWKDVAINIGGFVPFGWCVCAYLACVRQVKRPAAAAILLAGALSIAIEMLQTFLPTRTSSLTDFVTNTLGACFGVMLWRSSVLQSLFAMAGLAWAVEDGRVQARS